MTNEQRTNAAIWRAETRAIAMRSMTTRDRLNAWADEAKPAMLAMAAGAACSLIIVAPLVIWALCHA